METIRVSEVSVETIFCGLTDLIRNCYKDFTALEGEESSINSCVISCLLISCGTLLSAGARAQKTFYLCYRVPATVK